MKLAFVYVIKQSTNLTKIVSKLFGTINTLIGHLIFHGENENNIGVWMTVLFVVLNINYILIPWLLSCLSGALHFRHDKLGRCKLYGNMETKTNNLGTILIHEQNNVTDVITELACLKTQLINLRRRNICVGNERIPATFCRPLQLYLPFWILRFNHFKGFIAIIAISRYGDWNAMHLSNNCFLLNIFVCNWIIDIRY